MANIELDGVNKKIKVDSGDLTLDVPGDIVLDADGGDVVFADGGTNLLKVTNSSSDVVLQPQVDTKDIIFKQYDGTTVATIEDNGTLNVPTGKLAINATAITSTAAELNILDGVTATATELNLIDGVTATTAELNILDGVTSTAAELNIVDGNTSATSTTIADADRVVLNDNGTMVQAAVTDLKTYIGGGIAEADQWRVSANESTWTSSGRHYITSDWERVDNSQFEHIGSGMSESSGVFTFPSTGKYYIRFQLDWTNREGGTNRALTYMMAEIGVTANNSSYSQFAHGNSSNDDAGGEYYHSVATTYILDVSDVSNIKTKFGAYVANNMKYLGNTGYNKTHVTFIKLGDT